MALLHVHWEVNAFITPSHCIHFFYTKQVPILILILQKKKFVK